MKALTEKDMMQDILYHLKDFMTASGMAVKESTCEKMRALVTTASGQFEKLQFKLFQYMHAHGMYPYDNATPAQLRDTIAIHKPS